MGKRIEPLLKTVIGSYPTPGLKGLEAVRRAVEDQIQVGVELVSDGQTRKDMVSYFADHIPGFRIKEDKLNITDKISSPDDSPIVKDLLFAKKILPEGRALKGILTGPVTLISSAKIERSSPYQGFLDQKLYVDMGEALRKEADLLIKTGISYLQIDEPFYSVGAPLDLAEISIRIITENIKLPVALHVCGNITKVLHRLVKFPGVDVLSLEFAASPGNFSAVNRSELEENGKILGVGCVNSQSNEVEAVEVIKGILDKAVSIIGSEDIVVHPDCGLKLLSPESAYNKLDNMVKATDGLKYNVK